MKKIRSLYSAVVLIYNKHIEQKEGIKRCQSEKRKRKIYQESQKYLSAITESTIFRYSKMRATHSVSCRLFPVIDNYLKKDEVFKNLYIYDDGLIRGFIQMNGTEICKLYVDPWFQGRKIGHELITFAVEQFGADHLWALEKNERALAFYRRHGFVPTGKREFEEGTTKYIVELKKKELTVNQFVQNGNRHL